MLWIYVGLGRTGENQSRESDDFDSTEKVNIE